MHEVNKMLPQYVAEFHLTKYCSSNYIYIYIYIYIFIYIYILMYEKY